VGCAQEGEEDPAAGAPRATERGVSAARAAGALSPDDPGEFVIVVVVGGGERQGAGPREVESPTPVTEGRRGGRGAGTRDGRGGARCRAVRRGGRMHRRRADKRRGDGGRRRGGGGSRTLEKEEAWLLEFQVGGVLPRCPRF
jgi:hypothetical protein